METYLDKFAKTIKFEAAVRQLYSRVFSGSLPFYILNEYPKSGGTWIGLMLAEALEVPFPRHCVPKFETSILHGHLLNPLGLHNVVTVMRDGRDVMVSWYHHCLFTNEYNNNSHVVERVTRELGIKDTDDVVSNLSKFIEYSFVKSRQPRFTWSKFVDTWYDHPSAVLVKYEDFRSDGAAVLADTVLKLANVQLDPVRAQMIVDKYSFGNMTGRKTGEEKKNSFLRKGIVGDWKNSFNQESNEVFAHFASSQLIKLGYELDTKWAESSKIA